MAPKFFKLPVCVGDVTLNVAKGHFATSHSHTNYFIDVTAQKASLREAEAVAQQLAERHLSSTMVDTILCLDGTAVLGTCLAEELTRRGVQTINSHQSIYVLEPEYNANSQIIFRDNIQPMIRGKHVLVLMASVTTGFTARRSMEAIGYYGGKVSGVAAVYRAIDEVAGYPIWSIYSVADLPEYESYDFKDCPYCKAGKKLDALVNSFGYSAL